MIRAFLELLFAGNLLNIFKSLMCYVFLIMKLRIICVIIDKLYEKKNRNLRELDHNP